MPGRRRYSGQRFRRSFRHFLIGRSAQALATLGVTLLAIRALDGTSYGLYMVTWGCVEILAPLTSLGLLPAVQRYLPELAEHGSAAGIRRFVWPMMAARIVLVLAGGLVFGLFWPAIAAWMGQPAVPAAQGGVGAAIIVAVLLSRFSAEMLECLLEQKSAQGTRALLPLLRLAGLVAALLTGSATLMVLLWIDLVAAALAMLMGEALLARALRRLRPDGDYQVPRAELARYIWHLSGAQLLNAVSSPGTLRLIVARTLGAEAAGHFGFLQQLVITGKRYLPSVLFANLVRPMMIARSEGADRAAVATGLGLLWKVNVMTVWPLVPAMWLAGQPLFALLSGGRVVESSWVAVLLLAGLAAQAQNQTLTLAMQVYKLGASIRTMNLAALLALPAVWWASRWGLVGVVAGVAAAFTLRNLLGMAILRRRALPMDIDGRGAAGLLGAIAAATAIGWGTLQLAGPWAGAAALLAGYAAALALLRPLAPAEGALLVRAAGRPVAWMERFVRRVRPR